MNIEDRGAMNIEVGGGMSSESQLPTESQRSKKHSRSKSGKQSELLQKMKNRRTSSIIRVQPLTAKNQYAEKPTPQPSSPRHLMLDSITIGKNSNSRVIPQIEQFQLSKDIKQSLKRKRQTNNLFRQAQSFSTVQTPVRPNLTVGKLSSAISGNQEETQIDIAIESDAQFFFQRRYD